MTLWIFVYPQENNLNKAIDFFYDGNFTEAELLFKKLLDQNPQLSMLNYYYGACRTENNNFGEQEINYLLLALKSKEPTKIQYYLGIQYQTKEEWEKALDYFNHYWIYLSSNNRTDSVLDQKISECFKKVNPYKNVVNNNNNLITQKEADIEKHITKDTTSVLLNKGINEKKVPANTTKEVGINNVIVIVYKSDSIVTEKNISDVIYDIESDSSKINM